MMAHNFIGYWRALSTEEKEALAKDVGVGRNYLTQIAGGHKQPPDHMVRLLVEARKDIHQTWFV